MKIMLGVALALGLVGISLTLAQPPQGEQVAPSNAAVPPRASRAPEVIARSVPIDLAVQAAKVANTCAGSHAGVVVLDQMGVSKLYYLADSTPGTHGTAAFRKASTALLINGPSEGLRNRIAADPAIADKVIADQDSSGKNKTYVSQTGGLPIVVKGEVIGAIGVSGGQPIAKDK